MCSNPIQAVITDNNLQNYIKSIENPWVKCTLKMWKTFIKEYKLEGDIILQHNKNSVSVCLCVPLRDFSNSGHNGEQT